VHGLEIDVDEQTAGLGTVGMAFHEVEIFQRVPASLRDDETPVLEGMGKFPQKGIYALGEAVVFGHDFLQRSIFFINTDVDMVFGKIDLKGFGFYFQRVVPPESLKQLRSRYDDSRANNMLVKRFQVSGVRNDEYLNSVTTI
jgi:hypothetical protein